MKPVLYPPLERIRRELFEKGGDSRVDTVAEESVPLDPLLETVAATPLPAHLLDLIRRQAEAARAHPPSPPAVGQIRFLSAVPAAAGGLRHMERGCGILLGAHLGGKLWSGWLVAQEVDYATDRDLVIEEDDGPIDPVAGIVQTWNPIRVIINGSERILGKLSPLRLAAVMALAEAPASDGEAKPRPGKVYGRDLAEGIVVATGSPLGGTDDPRHEYRALYRQLAEEFVAASEMKEVRKPASESRGFMQWLFGPHWAPAPVLGVALALFIAQGLYQASQIEGGRESERYRADALACNDEARIRVVFNPNAPQADTLLLLRKVEARVVDGPSETGELWLSVPAGASIDEALAQIKASALVDQALIVSVRDPRCKK